MALTLSTRVWVLIERLYIHCHSPDEFLNLLREADIEYPSELYPTLSSHPNTYIFMSEPNYTFAEFMKLVPSYKYIPLLERVAFDAKVQRTQKDNWNYYGEYIRNWYPELINLLNLAGIKVNKNTKKLDYEEELEAPATDDFLPNNFGDIFLDYIRKEINETYKSRNYLSVMFLSRKVLEVIIIRVFELVFPKILDRQYSAENHRLWYDKRNARYHNFETLLLNLKQNASRFDEDKDLIIQLVEYITPLKNATNECVHRDYKIPDATYVSQWKIPYVIGLANKVFRKYCNP